MTRHFALCWALSLAALAGSAAEPGDDVAVGLFSALEPGGTPAGWDTLHFPSIDRETDYSLLEEDGRVVLQATSRGAASALVREVAVDPNRHPYLSWSWKTDRPCFTGNWQQPDADDFPLRLFVVFENSGGLFSFFRTLGSGFSGDVLLYLGDVQRRNVEERVSHLSDRIKVVPLSGVRDGLGWDRLVRDVRADYMILFGEEPRHVKAVAVMTDTDNSATYCVSYFGDILFSKTRP